MARTQGNVVFPTNSDPALYEAESEIQLRSYSASIVNTATNQIGIQLKLLVRILQYVGGYPIKIDLSQNCSTKSQSDSNNSLTVGHVQNNDSKNLYETTISKWTEAGAWYSYIGLTLKMFCIVTYLCNVGLGIAFPVKLFSTGPGLKNDFWTKHTETNYNRIVFIGTFALYILKTLLVFWNTPEFVRWLNNWSDFERVFLNCFNANFQNISKQMISIAINEDLGRFSNRLLLVYLALPMLFWTVFVGIFTLPMYIYHVKFVSHACMIVGILAMFVQPLMEDAKVLIMLKTHVLAFNQIWVGINEFGQSHNWNISPTIVIGWRDLVKQVRDQTVLASTYLKGQEIMSVAETIISCSVVVSYVLKALARDELKGSSIIITALVNLYTGCHYLVRLYIKILLAEKITCALPKDMGHFGSSQTISLIFDGLESNKSLNDLKERLVAEEVLQIDAKTRDASTKIELKFLYSRMTQNPIDINFGNYFSLDKKLLLNVGAQVVTYLIVIMQFESSK